MLRRTLLAVLLVAGTAVPAAATTPPPADTPQDAVTAVKRVLKRTIAACETEWIRIDAVGYAGEWKVDVKVRDSVAGKGLARWTIGDGWPVARNALARALARGCD